jgi:hypothetical protein
MKTDLYTKAVLTVIAIALVCLVFQNYNVIPAAHASAPVNTHSTDVNRINEVIDVRIVDCKYNFEVPVAIKSPIHYRDGVKVYVIDK